MGEARLIALRLNLWEVLMRKNDRFTVPSLLILTLLLGGLVAPQVLAASETQTEGICTAAASCWDGSTVFCTGQVSCSFQDSACTYYRGHALCDGVKHYCPPCPSCSTEGDFCDFIWDCRPPGEPECAFCDCYGLKGERGVCVCPDQID
jgi:hypothetical protein